MALRSRVISRMAEDSYFWVAVAVIGAAMVVALLGPSISPYDPNATHLANRLASPSRAHLFGTDDLGRDVLSRMLVATRISMLVPFESVAIAIVLGLPTGLIAGFSVNRLGILLNFVADTLMSFPPLLLAVAFIAVRGPGLTNAMIAVGLIFAPRLYRVARAATQEVMAETYIEAARAIGSSRHQILLWHVLRNMAGPVIVYISFAMGIALLIEASLSFLGLGVQPPQAGWGSMLGRAFRFLYQSPTGIIFPGIAIAVMVLAFNLLGDAARDALGRRTGETSAFT